MTWDANKVLSYLKSLGPNDSLSLKQLTLKTAHKSYLDGEFIHYICSVLTKWTSSWIRLSFISLV